MVNKKPNVNDVLRKYGKKIEGQVKSSVQSGGNYSSAYKEFKSEMAPEYTRYERWCHSLGNFLKVKASAKEQKEIKKWLDIAHLDVDPSQAVALGLISFILVLLFGIILSVAAMLITSLEAGETMLSNFPAPFFIMTLFIGMFLFYYLKGFPQRLANKWRLKASSQMVPAILYIVVYMRHTPNLEKAIAFASEHLEPPLSLDLRKVFYNVQVGKFSTIKESLDFYLETWKDYSPAFIESFHLIESSLFEPSNERRIATLEKSLQVVLDGVYEQMLKFVHEVKSPIQNTYMLGTTLPVLGIALLPLASALLEGLLKANHLFLLYNLIIPFIAFFLMNKFLLLRPGGYGETSLLEKNPYYSTYKSKKHYYKAFFLCLPLLLIGLLPLMVQYAPDSVMTSMGFVDSATGDVLRDFTFGQAGFPFMEDEQFFGFVYDENTESLKGPFGIGALLLGMFVPLGFALFFIIAYMGKTKQLIKEREKTKNLENEFNNSIFQLGNRIGNGMPPELAFGRVAESTTGLMTEDFFKRVNYNIRQMGMGVDKAIFDPHRGAIVYYPSNLIATSMRILIEASKKGLKVAAISLMSISEYVKNIHKISSRLRDILSEVVSDMRSNMTFLAPLLAGVVVGLSTMIATILSKLKLSTSDVISGSDYAGSAGDLMNSFDIVSLIPPYHLQIAIGIYLIEIVFILTTTLVTIDAGEDKLAEKNSIAKNLRSSILMYLVVALLSTLALFALAVTVM